MEFKLFKRKRTDSIEKLNYEVLSNYINNNILFLNTLEEFFLKLVFCLIEIKRKYLINSIQHSIELKN